MNELVVEEVALVSSVRHESLELARYGISAHATHCPQDTSGWLAVHRKLGLAPGCHIPKGFELQRVIHHQIDVYYRAAP